MTIEKIKIVRDRFTEEENADWADSGMGDNQQSDLIRITQGKDVCVVLCCSSWHIMMMMVYAWHNVNNTN